MVKIGTKKRGKASNLVSISRDGTMMRNEASNASNENT